MLKAHRTEIYVVPAQARYLAGACGAARFLYNQLLARASEAYKKDGTRWSVKEARSHLYALKEENEWMGEYSSDIYQSVIVALDDAFKRFFKKLARFPKFKRKSDDKDSLSIRLHPKFRVDGRMLYFEKCNRRGGAKGLRLREAPRFGDKAEHRQLTITRDGDKFFASILYRLPDEEPLSVPDVTVGVDLGLKTLAVVSDGRQFSHDPNKSRAALDKKRKRAQRRMSRRFKKGAKTQSKTQSKNYAKAKRSHKKVCRRIKANRANNLHRVSNEIVSSAGVIGIEDLKATFILRNRRLARKAADCALYELRRQIEYKSKWTGRAVVIANRTFPSTQICSGCGHRKTGSSKLTLEDREYVCTECGFAVDRDMNAAYNLENLASQRTDAGRPGSDESPAAERGKTRSGTRSRFISQDNRNLNVTVETV